MSSNSKSCKTQQRRTFRPAPTLSSGSRPGTVPLQPHNSQPRPQSDSRIKNPAVAFVFNPHRDEVKSYHTDGDSEMYTTESVAKRSALKSSASIISSIRDFMSLYRESPSGCVSRSEYESVQTKICHLLRPSIPDSELRTAIEEDWRRDTKGAAELTKDALFESLFELCDVWVPGVAEEEYVAFFEQLRFRLRYEGLQNTAAYDILR